MPHPLCIGLPIRNDGLKANPAEKPNLMDKGEFRGFVAGPRIREGLIEFGNSFKAVVS
jgi:hypothetical protein